ncbi:hypothetical protein AVEN_37812-1 [Araneus ventricosus]|uniref:Uncharacterized protein n=1 Tax=Araneus ventricosus TaxID=182803 RepID=A0A4Y2G3F2_ARAVE|nr:hypothetical protein AVEN_37812-1 [Araneus ventricosus]
MNAGSIPGSEGYEVLSLATKKSYNPDLALFVPLKPHVVGKHFADDDDVQHEVLLWMRQQPKEFYVAGIGEMIKRWDKCINIGGDSVENKIVSN